ncbi:MAG: tetratricopeptide repeat protein, partial [Acidobacteriaceae bacterium]|nr:tetratricopeptide repeat protein [Acidobacteriaceae bacterium]
MKMKLFVPLVLVLLVLAAIPVFAVNKDMVQLQTQVSELQQQMTAMKQSFDERMGVMRNLIEQSTDNINRMATSVDTLQKTVQQQGADTGGRVDQVSTQVQALHDSIDELKTRLANVSKQLDDMRNSQQNLTAGAPGVAGAPIAGAAATQAPPPDVLYNNALRDYNAGKYDLATQEFNDYLKFYPTTDLAGNAQFYVGDIQYRQGDFQGSIQSFNRVLEQYPGGNKSAAAQLKKG